MLDNILVISPHLDDAVLSCGDFLSVHPNAVVVTVFAGTPANADLNADLLTSWDAASGFSGAAEAMQTRRKEDLSALQMLDAAPHWLDFLDSQYLATPSIDDVARSLRTVLDEICPATVLYPAEVRDTRGRRFYLMRNVLWVAWMRLPLGPAVRETLRLCRSAYGRRRLMPALMGALRGLPWVLRKRQVIAVETAGWYSRLPR